MDLLIFQKINQFAGKWACLDRLGIFFAEYFEYFLIFCLLVFLLVNFKKYWPMIWQALLAGLISRFVITDIIRHFLPRLRPFIEHHVNLLIPYNPAEPSFPSGHAAFYFALSAVIFAYNKRAGLWFFAASFLIVISRVFVGIHWPSDILAGALIGILIGWLVNRVLKKR